MKRSICSALTATVLILLVPVGTAPATTITSPKGTVATPTLEAQSEGHFAIDVGGGLPPIECSSLLAGPVESHGESKQAEIGLTTLTYSSCTNGWHVTVFLPGTLTIEGGVGYSGAVTWSEATIAATREGVTCRFFTNKTFMGVLKGGSPATLTLSGWMSFHSGSPLCGTGPVALTGSYKLTSPASLFVDGNVVEAEAGSALTSPENTVSTSNIRLESDGTVSFDLPVGTVTCVSTFEGEIVQDGDEVPAGGFLSAFTFPLCGEGWHVAATAPGSIVIKAGSGGNGTVFSSGATIEATNGGLTCRFLTKSTKLGTLTAGAPATLDLEASLPFHSGSIFCGTGPYSFTGSYEVVDPSSLYVDKTPLEVGITSPTGTTATPTIKAESEGYVSLDHPIAKIQCLWTLEGTVKSHGAEEGASIPLSGLSTTGCTESWHATTVTSGELNIAWTSGYNGTVVWIGGTVEMTRSGLICRYKAEGLDLGTLTGGAPATLDLEGKLPFHGGSPLCGEEAYNLTGSLKVTSPSSLYVDKFS